MRLAVHLKVSKKHSRLTAAQIDLKAMSGKVMLSFLGRMRKEIHGKQGKP